MGSTGQKCVVVKLDGIPIVKRGSAVQTRAQSCKTTTDADGGVVPSREATQRRVRGGGINRRGAFVVNHRVPVETKPRRIDQGWGENVTFFQRCDVPRGLIQDR